MASFEAAYVPKGKIVSIVDGDLQGTAYYRFSARNNAEAIERALGGVVDGHELGQVRRIDGGRHKVVYDAQVERNLENLEETRRWAERSQYVSPETWDRVVGATA